MGGEETVQHCGGMSANGVMVIQNVEQIVKFVQKFKWGGGGVGWGSHTLTTTKPSPLFFIICGVK